MVNSVIFDNMRSSFTGEGNARKQYEVMCATHYIENPKRRNRNPTIMDPDNTDLNQSNSNTQQVREIMSGGFIETSSDN